MLGLLRARHFLRLLCLGALASCANLKPKTRSEAAPQESKLSPSPIFTTVAPPPPAVESVELPKIPDKAAEKARVNAPEEAPDQLAEKSRDKAPAKALAEVHIQAPGVDAGKALTWLKNGNLRFVKRNYRKDGRSAQDRARLAKAQTPHSIILSCSDSRVPPELVFDQALGEIFVIRVAGEALDSSVVASLEYAVEHLGSHLVVVMGHESCGAVQAAVDTAAGKSAGSESLDHLVGDIRPRIAATLKGAPSAGLVVESSENAKGVARDILARSPLLKKRADAGELKIVPALYRLESGQVEFF